MILYGADGLTQRRQAYELLRLAAAEQWGYSSLPPILRDGHGKPHFAGQEPHHFNLSHSGGLALCVLDDAPVGVDIQIVKAWRPSLPARACSQEELAWLGQGEDFWPRFTLLWALKESRVKCSGEGLTRRIAGIRVPLPEHPDGPYALENLWFQAYQGDGWRGAVCGRTPPPAEIRWMVL